MVDHMEEQTVRSFRGGVNQSGVRAHNERLLLSVLQRDGAMSGVALARRMGLTPPAVSTILRKLEADGFLTRGEPVRGKVGKPSIPMQINPDGAFSIGLKVGRRSADLVLLDFVGAVRSRLHTTYHYPLPDTVFAFLRDGLETLLTGLPALVRDNLCGIGIAAPFEMWKWHDLVGEDTETFRSWKDVDFHRSIAAFSDLPVFMVNDATAACRAEHLFGRGKEHRDYAYFFVGSFVGGGIVLNHTVFEGNQGNAGALGSMRATGPMGESHQLIDVASIHVLERRMVEAELNPDMLWTQPQDWSALSRYVEPWIGQTAQELAKAALTVCAVLDFEAILIDGAFPTEVREALVERVRRYIVNQDTRGLITPRIEAGAVGPNAREIGAASSPMFHQFFLDTHAGLSAM